MACPRAREVESTTRAMVPKYFVIRSSDKYRGTGPEDFSWILYYGLARSYLSRATPTQTRTAAIQRRWSTASFRKILAIIRSEKHTSELQSHLNLVFRLLL